MASEAVDGGRARFSPLTVGARTATPDPGATRVWHPTEFRGADRAEPGGATPAEPIVTAQAEAERLLSAARQKAHELEAEAKADRQGAREEVEAIRKFATRFEGELQRAKQELLAGIESEVAALAARMAGKIVRRVIEADADVVVNIVRDTLRKVTEGGRVRVYVHPQDRQRIEDSGDDLRLALEAGATLEVLEDDGVERGGCIVRTDEVEINADIAHQLTVLQDRFDQVREGAHRSAA